MSSVPISIAKLEAITTNVARELLEEWAINDRYEEDQIEKATENAVGDTIFIINSFMEHMNSAMLEEAESVNKKLII